MSDVSFDACEIHVTNESPEVTESHADAAIALALAAKANARALEANARAVEAVARALEPVPPAPFIQAGAAKLPEADAGRCGRAHPHRGATPSS